MNKNCTAPPPPFYFPQTQTYNTLLIFLLAPLNLVYTNDQTILSYIFFRLSRLCSTSYYYLYSFSEQEKELSEEDRPSPHKRWRHFGQMPFITYFLFLQILIFFHQNFLFFKIIFKIFVLNSEIYFIVFIIILILTYF